MGATCDGRKPFLSFLQTGAPFFTPITIGVRINQDCPANAEM